MRPGARGMGVGSALENGVAWRLATRLARQPRHAAARVRLVAAAPPTTRRLHPQSGQAPAQPAQASRIATSLRTCGTATRGPKATVAALVSRTRRLTPRAPAPAPARATDHPRHP